MIRKKSISIPTVHSSTLLFICALLPALLFKGPNIEFFAITQIVLVMWLGLVVLRSYDSGIRIPKSMLALCLTLFWSWLALSLAWSTAPNISVINFWWVGSLVLVFWLYTLTPDRDSLWSHASMIMLVLGLVAALMAIYQVQVYGEQARSVFETRNTHAAFLNIIVLPASAYLLQLMSGKGVPRHYAMALSIVLYILFLSIFMTASRGATLSLVISLGVLIALTVRYVPGRTIILLLLLTLAAFLTTKIAGEAGGVGRELSERLPSLMQDTGRRIIWESSWNLLKDSPWYGIGLGLFYLAYPPYRNPVDNSGGFFAHNDYLQIWIETGLPGLLLLLSVLFSALWLFMSVLNKSRLNKDARVELTGLFCGLLAVASHSFVDFNLYILSIMMMAGLVMGRFHSLAARELGIPSMHVPITTVVGKLAFPIIVILLAFIPIFYFVALGAANSYYDRALMLAQQGSLEAADKNLAAAQRLTPWDDRVLIAHADLYRHAASLLSSDVDITSRKSLYKDAILLLDRAQQANPLRGLADVIRSRLHQENPELAGDAGSELAAESLRRALALSPKMFQARLEYVQLLLQQGKRDEAYVVMEEGVKYEYYFIPNLIPFYSLAAKLRREAGRLEAAMVLEKKVHDLEMQAKASYSFRGY